MTTNPPDSTDRRLGAWDAGLVLAAVAAALVTLYPLHGLPLGWDEVNYVSAASLGAAANMWETGAPEPKDLSALIVAKVRREPALLGPRYREQGDPLVLRHYHPPLVVMLMACLPRGGEQLARLVQAVGAVALLVSLAWSYRRLGGRGRLGLLVAVMLGLWMVRILFEDLSFHGWLAVWVVLVATLLRLQPTKAPRGPGLLLAVALAAAGLTLESAVFVWIAVAAYLLIAGCSLRRIAVCLGLAFVLVLLAWPGALYRLSMVRTAALYAYRILVVGDEYAGVWSRLPSILVALLPGCLSYLAVLVAAIRPHFDRDDAILPLWMVGTAYLAGLVCFALAPQYLLPGLAPVCVAAALIVDRARTGLIRWGLTCVLVTTVIGVWPAGADLRSARLRQADWRWLVDEYAGRRLFVDGGHILRYYFPAVADVESLHVSRRPPCYFLRERAAYHPLVAEDLSGGVFAISITRTGTGSCEWATFARCRRHERPTFVVFDCGFRNSLAAAAGVTGP